MSINKKKGRHYCYQNPARTIKEMVACCIEEAPGNDAFKVKEKGVIKHVSFFQMHKDVQNLGTELLCMDVLQDKPLRVGIIGENSYAWMQAFLAAVNGGGIAVPFDKGFTAEELASCIARSEITVLFYDEKHQTVAEEAAAQCGIEKPVLLQMSGEGEVLEQMKLDGEQKVRAGERRFLDAEVSEKQLAVILFTSGTTANSKAVMLSHDNILSNIRDMQAFERFYPWDVNMAFLPFHHSFGLVGALVFMASCACSVFCDGLRYVTKNLGEYGVTVFVGVPLIVENMYKKICRQIEKEGKQHKIQVGLKLAGFAEVFRLPVRRRIFKQVIDGLGGHLRLIICGAAPLMPETSAGMNGFGIATIQGYGLTETSPVLAAERPEDIAAGSVGKPMPSVNIQLFGEDENGIGEIVARGPNVMMGYLNQPEETAEVLKDGWFYTGDLGRFDAHGNLYITGRKKNVIVMKNGKNIFPEEIEEKISRLPYAAECLVFAREKHNDLVLWTKIVYPEDYLKEKNWTVDQLAEQVRMDLGAINDAMPKYKHINHFILSHEPMIKTTTQKIKRIPEIEKINAQQDSELWYNCTM